MSTDFVEVCNENVSKDSTIPVVSNPEKVPEIESTVTGMPTEAPSETKEELKRIRPKSKLTILASVENGVLRIPFPLLQNLGILKGLSFLTLTDNEELKEMLKDPKIQQMFRNIDQIHNNQSQKPEKTTAPEPDMEEGEINETESEKPEELPVAPPQYDLETCMGDPYFLAVIDKMLQLVGVRDEEGNSIA